MPLQTTARRLLTEAAAGVQAANPATPLGAALAALLGPKLDDALAGAPGGLATLGGDGKVPAGQLPPPLTVLNAVKTTDQTIATESQLMWPAVPVGRYALEGFVILSSTGGNVLSAAWPAAGGVGNAVLGNSTRIMGVTAGTVAGSMYQVEQGAVTTNPQKIGSVPAATGWWAGAVTGMVHVTTAGKVGPFTWTGPAGSLIAGSWLRLSGLT